MQFNFSKMILLFSTLGLSTIAMLREPIIISTSADFKALISWAMYFALFNIVALAFIFLFGRLSVLINMTLTSIQNKIGKPIFSFWDKVPTSLTLSVEVPHYKHIRAIYDERLRQISKEGYTPEHDDEHVDGSLANAAAHYACADDNINLWTWDKNYDKKDRHSRYDQLKISGAMIIAEMERLERSGEGLK